MQISVITVNLNNKVGLIKTLDSVINQSYKDYELIVIDGGSTDGSVEEIQKRKEHIHYWVSEKDKGIYNAMNKGIKHANGEFVIFINSGDYLLSESSMTNAVSKFDNSDIFYCDTIIRNKRISMPELVSLKLFTYDSLPHNATFIKSSKLKERPYEEIYSILADMEWFLFQLLNNASFKKVDIALIVYDHTGISSISRGSVYEKNRVQRAEILNKYIPEYILQDYKQFTSRFMGFVLRIDKLDNKLQSIVKWNLRIILLILEKVNRLFNHGNS